MAKPRHKSRATRAGEAAEVLRNQAAELREIVEEIETAETAERLNELYGKANDQVALIDGGEIDALAEEMGSWRDNMSGTNLESTDRYSRVEEAADTLENAQGEIEGLSLPDMDATGGDVTEETEDGNLNDDDEPDLDEVRGEMKEAIEEIADTLEQTADDLENIDFPTMFG